MDIYFFVFLIQIQRLNRKRKPPTTRSGFGKRFRTVYDKLAAESLLLLSNTSPFASQNRNDDEILNTTPTAPKPAQNEEETLSERDELAKVSQATQVTDHDTIPFIEYWW